MAAFARERDQNASVDDLTAITRSLKLDDAPKPAPTALTTPASGVVIIHHDDMQCHVPPTYRDIFELPRRVIAIENRLKGIPFETGFPKQGNFGERMQMLPRSHVRERKAALCYGSPTPKKLLARR